MFNRLIARVQSEVHPPDSPGFECLIRIIHKIELQARFCCCRELEGANFEKVDTINTSRGKFKKGQFDNICVIAVTAELGGMSPLATPSLRA